MDNSITIAVLGDIHIKSNGNGLKKFRHAIKGLVSKCKKPDFIILMGDVVYQINEEGGAICDKLYEAPYIAFLSIMNELAKGIPYIYVAGNHEYPQNNINKEITDEARNLYMKYSGFPINYCKELGLYKFIVLGCNDWPGHITEDGESFAINEIEKSIKEDSNRPVFLLLHKPIKGTVFTDVTFPMLYSEEFVTYLKRKPQVINLVADLHIPVQDPKTIYQQGFTSIHTPMTSVGMVCNYGCENSHSSSSEPPFAQALSLEINNNKVLVNKINTINNSYIDCPWEIDIPKLLQSKKAYLYTDERINTSMVPVFPNDATINVTRENELITLCFSQATTDTSTDHGNGFCQYYEIHIKDAVTNKEIVRKKYVRQYWLEKTEPLFKCELAITKGSYDITVYPLNPFERKGIPLHCVITI